MRKAHGSADNLRQRSKDAHEALAFTGETHPGNSEQVTGVLLLYYSKTLT